MRSGVPLTLLSNLRKKLGMDQVFVVWTRKSGPDQPKVVWTTDGSYHCLVVWTTLLVQTRNKWYEPASWFTPLWAGLNLNFRFEPGTRGLDQQCGSNRVAGEYHFFLVRTRNFGLNHPKVVWTMRRVHTTLGWFRPLFLVQTGKTWPSLFLSAYNPLNESAPRCSPRAVLHG